MIVDVHIGVPRPEMVDKTQVLAVLPHGKGSVLWSKEGLRSTTISSASSPSTSLERGIDAKDARHSGIGFRNVLHGPDHTKAAPRAVQDALHHSSLSFVRSLKIDKTKLDVEVTIGVQRPEQVELDKVKNSLPVGNVTVKAIKGGLDVADPENNDPAAHCQCSHRGSHRGGMTPALDLHTRF